MWQDAAESNDFNGLEPGSDCRRPTKKRPSYWIWVPLFLRCQMRSSGIDSAKIPRVEPVENSFGRDDG